MRLPAALLLFLLATALAAGESVATVGTLEPRLRAELGSSVSGRVEQVLVDVGSAVAAGDPLVVLDRALTERDRQVAQAAVAVAEARATTAAAAVPDSVLPSWIASRGRTAAASSWPRARAAAWSRVLV